MKFLVAVVGLTLSGLTALVHGDNLSFEIQVGSNAPTTESLAPSSGGMWTYSSGTITLDNSTITTAPIPGLGQSGLVIDPDPAINYGFGVTNNGTSAQQYTFTFPMPSSALSVNLPPGLYNLSATFGDTLTANPEDTANFSLPTAVTTYQQSFINGIDAGVDIASAGNNPETVVGGTDGETQVFGFPHSTNQLLLASTGTTMSITTTFDLSPGDSASFSGSFTVTAAPEPSSLGLGLLAALGFAALVVQARRRRV